jgi:hypothetical protein
MESTYRTFDTANVVTSKAIRQALLEGNPLQRFPLQKLTNRRPMLTIYTHPKYHINYIDCTQQFINPLKPCVTDGPLPRPKGCEISYFEAIIWDSPTTPPVINIGFDWLSHLPVPRHL